MRLLIRINGVRQATWISPGIIQTPIQTPQGRGDFLKHFSEIVAAGQAVFLSQWSLVIHTHMHAFSHIHALYSLRMHLFGTFRVTLFAPAKWFYNEF